MSWIDAVSQALMHFLWQGALVAGGLALALRILDRRGAAATMRYLVALAALAVMAILPASTLWILSAEAPLPAAVAPSPGSGAGGPVAAGSVARAPLAPGGPSSPVVGAVTSWMPTAPWVFYTWLSGVLALSLYHLAGLWQVASLRTRGTRPAPQRWRTVLDRLRRRLEISRPVRLLESSRVAVPTVAGWLAPVVLLPARALSGLSSQQLEAVLAHELAHLRRQDHWVNLVQAMIETVLFYHPAVWWVSQQVRVEREHCCDDVAVEITGDRLLVARALTELEGLRVPSLRHAGALAADGGVSTPGPGSLAERVRRLVGVSATARSPRRTRAWLAGLLAFVLIGGGYLAVSSASPGPMEALAEVSFDPQPSQTDRRGGGRPGPGAVDGDNRVDVSPPIGVQGRWTGEIRDDGVWIQISYRDQNGEGRHQSSFSLRTDELVGLGTGSSFELRRDAGTFTFEGSFDGRREGSLGSGTVRFAGNPGYVRDMHRLGYSETTLDETLELALFDVSLGFVQELNDLGYENLGLKGLVQFRIHGVSPGYIREIAALGYGGLPAEELVAFRIHGVSPDFVRALDTAGYGGLAAQTLVTFRIHGVSAGWIGEMAALGHRELDIEDLVGFRIHGVSPSFVGELRDLGYDGLTPKELVQFRIHGVQPEMIRELESLGYRDLTPDELVRFRIHGVSSSFVEDLRRDGYDDLSPEELIEHRIHGRHRKHATH